MSVEMIIPIGVDCTLNHGLSDYLGYNIFYDNGVRKSPFGATWIYSPECEKGKFHPTNYGSLSVVAKLILSDFAGWGNLKKNFRGKWALVGYPVEFTHYFGTHETEANLNREAVRPFLDAIRGNGKIVFCSVWRAYKDFTTARIADDKSLFDHGVSDFSSAVQCDYDMKFFFIIDREHDAQRDYVRSIMRGHDMRYGILYNEIDKTPGRRWRQRFDAAGWPQALADVGLM